MKHKSPDYDQLYASVKDLHLSKLSHPSHFMHGSGFKVVVNGNLDRALRIFKQKVNRSNLVEDVNDRRFFESNTEKRHKKLKIAKSNEKRRKKLQNKNEKLWF